MMHPVHEPIDAPLYTAAQTRELDRLAIETSGVDGYTLMQRAGAAAFDVIRARWPRIRNLVVVAGTGKNGGDGWVVATLAMAAGFEVTVWLVGAEDRIQGEARQALDGFIAAGGDHQPVSDPRTAADCPLPKGDCLVVDALLGTGFRPPLRELHETVIRRINESALPVLALDCPSGLDADTGAPGPHAVHAAATVSFIGRNQGLFTGAGRDCAGPVLFRNLDVPETVCASVPCSARLLSADTLKRLLPQRPLSCHKGHWGHVCVLGGNAGMGGAAILASEAALRCGSGLVSVATRPDTVTAVLARRPEIMAHGVEEASDLASLLQAATVLVVGPGLGTDRWSETLLSRALEAATRRRLPLVLDADALNLLSHNRDWSLPGTTVLTPHPGEAARLLATTTAEVNRDRYAAVQSLARQFGATVVLKGAGTLISSAAGNTLPISVCPYGNPGMAVAGMGDVLAGVIGSLLGQGLSSRAAAELGVVVHALAGDSGAADKGLRGLLPSDLIERLPGILG